MAAAISTTPRVRELGRELQRLLDAGDRQAARELLVRERARLDENEAALLGAFVFGFAPRPR